MTISTLAQLQQARTFWVKWAFSPGSGSPTAPTIGTNYPDPANTTTGVVPTAGAWSFCPSMGIDDPSFSYYIKTFRAQDTNFYTGVHLLLYDRLWHAGQILVNSTTIGVTTTFSSQPSFASRLIGGSYAGCIPWVENCASTGGSFTGNFNYTNQDGVAGQVVSYSGAAQTAFAMMRPALASGDSGARTIDSFTVTNTTVGTSASKVNVVIGRPLAWLRLSGGATPPNAEQYKPMHLLPQIFHDSALSLYWSEDGNSLGSHGVFEVEVEIAVG